MEQRTLGKTGLDVSVLGFGGAEIGYEGVGDADVERLLGSALDAGLNTIDTAECYADSEEKIGRAVSHRRGDFHLFTKCGHTAGLEGADWEPKLLAESIDRSLQRLQVEHVDLIQLHSCSEDLLRQGDVITVLQRARDDGKTRFVGYSGDHNAALYAIECGAFDTLQTSVSIADQECITLTLPKAQAANIGVIAKRPLANVAWKYGDKQPANGYHQAYWERLKALDYDFLKSDDAVATALRFTLAQPGVCTAIVGTTKPDRWQSNAHLLDAGPLSQAQIDAIRARWREVSETSWVGQG
jgi:aryl-alcohol dehydrogenase-like predicted oxidoreductase